MTAMHSDVNDHDPLLCSQCGGALKPEEGQIFLKCPYCDSTIYLDRSRVVLHWYIADTLNESKARSVLTRWMGGNLTRKGLDREAQIDSTGFAYFPIWLIRTGNEQKEEIFIEPAAALSITKLKNIRLPAGDLRAFEPEINPSLIPPTIPVETAMGWHTQREVEGHDILEVSLVHLPLYTFHYTYMGKSFTAIVEGGTGSVFANSYPKRIESNYVLITVVIGFVFLCIACLPFYGSVFIRSSSTRIILTVALALIAVPILYSGAVWIALNK